MLFEVMMNYEEFANFLDSREKEDSENQELRDRNHALTETIEQKSIGKNISETISRNLRAV